MIRITMTIPPLLQGGSAWKNVLPRFQKEVGDLAVKAVQAHLGTEDLYSLDVTYAAAKPRRKGYQHVAGKPMDQPLIFSGSLYTGIVAIPRGDMVVITVADDHGITDKGHDYAEMWEERVQFLERGLQDVEDELPGLLERIIVEEMMLGI